MKVDNAYGITKNDVMRMAELSGMEFIEHEDEESFDEAFADGDVVYGSGFVKRLLGEMAEVAFSAEGDQFAEYVYNNRSEIYDVAAQVPEVVEMLVLGYKVGISNGSSGCMNDLGAFYYMGSLVEQDFNKAAELFEMAADAGCYQSVINLGYIYEYGRMGEPDFEKAYRWYSLAAALLPSYEAVYKLGDMFERGRGVPQDKKKAYRLYERSLNMAYGDVECAQPAFRIASMLIDPEGSDYGVQSDALRALSLFQQAEVGLRKDIASGQFYYVNRLREAIAGQEKARNLLEADDFTAGAK